MKLNSWHTLLNDYCLLYWSLNIRVSSSAIPEDFGMSHNSFSLPIVSLMFSEDIEKKPSGMKWIKNFEPWAKFFRHFSVKTVLSFSFDNFGLTTIYHHIVKESWVVLIYFPQSIFMSISCSSFWPISGRFNVSILYPLKTLEDFGFLVISGDVKLEQ